MATINWGDISSDESVKNTLSSVSRGITFVGQNKESISQGDHNQPLRRSIRFQFSDSDDDCSTDSEACNGSNCKEADKVLGRESDNETSHNVPQPQKNQEEIDSKKQKSMSKKEKQAKKSKELNDLNNLLDEFDIVNKEMCADSLIELEKVPSVSIAINNEKLDEKLTDIGHKLKKKKKKEKKERWRYYNE